MSEAQQAEASEQEPEEPEGLWLEFPHPDPGKPSVQRWFPDEDAAREALVAAGIPPKSIRDCLARPATPWMVIAEDESEEPLVYHCADMQAAIRLILTFCDEESGIDGLDAMRTLEQAAAEGATEVTVGPYRAMMMMGE